MAGVWVRLVRFSIGATNWVRENFTRHGGHCAAFLIFRSFECLIKSICYKQADFERDNDSFCADGCIKLQS